MDDSGHVSIAVEQLADSLSEKFKILQPLSENCCIYRVPEPMRSLHPSDYTPHMVSIGPYHRNKPELQVMEEHKIRYLHYFLQRTKVSMSRFLTLIKDKEVKLRNCYAETIHIDSNGFITMVLVDALFLIEFFLRSYKSDLKTNDDRILNKPQWFRQMRDDLWLLENQLPLFILADLFDLAKSESCSDVYEGISLVTITYNWLWLDVLMLLPIEEDSIEKHFPEAEHILDLLRLCLKPSKFEDRSEFKHHNIPGAKELYQAGVEFKRMSHNNLDFKFNNGILEIPFLTVSDTTQPLFRNLLAFESMHVDTRHFGDYVIMMSYLVNTPSDGELLVQNGIIGMGTAVSKTFDGLKRECFLTGSFQYSGLVGDLQAYCRLHRNKWKANLRQNYFNTPWAAISVIAAVILLLLTIAQTVSSFIGL